jgi:hypothetical protein
VAFLKARLRAWLIDLVREAIRIEMGAYTFVMPTDFAAAVTRKATSLKPASKPVNPEPSFEQMEREALEQQEKHYAERLS